MVSQSKYSPSAPSRAGSLDLIGGALALDFANTSSGRGSASCLEHLRAPEHVVAWAEHVGIIDQPTAERAARLIRADAPGFASLLADALHLREAIHRAAAAVARGGMPAPADLAIIKEACAAAIAAADLAPTGAHVAWTWPTDPPVKATLLGPVALAAVGLFRESDPSRIKQCQGEHCGWVFFDLTKNRSRRWCEMAVCGNRAKARRFVAKKA